MHQMNNYSHMGHMPQVTKDHCRRHMDQFVQITMSDGRSFHAIIIDVDDHNVTVLSVESSHPEHMHRDSNDNDERFFGPRYPGFRFRRLLLPLAGIAALSTIPFLARPFYPYPYYSPFYYPYF